MFQHWTFSHPGAASEGRAERHVADLRVAVTIPFESWQLMWTLRSLNISNTGILCAADVTDQRTAERAMDLDTLLDAEPEVQLQIDSPSEDLFAPSVPARLVRKTKRPWGIEIAFNFSSENDDLASLVASLEHNPHNPGRRQH